MSKKLVLEISENDKSFYIVGYVSDYGSRCCHIFDDFDTLKKFYKSVKDLIVTKFEDIDIFPSEAIVVKKKQAINDIIRFYFDGVAFHTQEEGYNEKKIDFYTDGAFYEIGCKENGDVEIKKKDSVRFVIANCNPVAKCDTHKYLSFIDCEAPAK